MAGQKVGYKRVSTIDRNTARQLDGLSLDKTFEDKASGKDTLRPQLQAALSYCREGDTLPVRCAQESNELTPANCVHC